jgi:hypothetical protein
MGVSGLVTRSGRDVVLRRIDGLVGCQSTTTATSVVASVPEG